MPVYLCQPGSAAAEPWRHGIQVYAAPFTMDASSDEKLKTADPPEGGASLERSTEGLRQHHSVDSAAANRNSTISQTASGSEEARTTTGHVTTTTGLPIRRVRHSEVVLVDDVCIAFDRYWLRLRWPGSRGGFAGYIALGKVSEEPNWLMKDTLPSTAPLGTYLSYYRTGRVLGVLGSGSVTHNNSFCHAPLLQKFTTSTTMTGH